MYFNTQEEIITKLSKSLEKSLILRKKAIKILAGIVIGIILAKSTVVSKIAENLKENFCEGKEASKIKKIKRFLNRKIADDMYMFFVEGVLKTFKAEDNKVVIIFDHTTCEDRFVILSFMLSIGKRGIPIYQKIYEYKDPNNKSYEKEFDRIREEYNLKGQIKTVSNIACEYIITSDKEFFERIGEKETKRYFEVVYQFVCEYKDLGEQYILSAKVHMDEQSSHMHLVFFPIVHTKDKKGNNIDKLACSEFWKEKDSYRQLQNAFYDYMVSHNFELERGLPKEETGRQHIDLKEYKEITNFKNTKETLKNIKLELPGVPDIKDIRKVMMNRDEKICNEIIKPKDELIQELYQDNVSLHKKLSKQAKVIELEIFKRKQILL